ncbi:hypothetical protein E2C01_059091 [Portunus trituberculatus]|uniref:Uncharacterized protein n=1 Tax=Portunus trituberculatus TaxID=210409 RepID=A0A5B7H7E6_PORTR|nr:hypothetical protein [Portunus trituberculatus]
MFLALIKGCCSYIFSIQLQGNYRLTTSEEYFEGGRVALTHVYRGLVSRTCCHRQVFITCKKKRIHNKDRRKKKEERRQKKKERRKKKEERRKKKEERRQKKKERRKKKVERREKREEEGVVIAKGEPRKREAVQHCAGRE